MAAASEDQRQAPSRQRSSNPPAPSTQTPSPGPRFRIGWRWAVFVLVLLVFNFWAGSRATKGESRVRVPYSPFFLQQVSSGNVAEITSKGTAIQGTFTHKERYRGSKPTTRFRTEIPAFADNTALAKLLQRKGVIVNAVPLDTGAPWWENLLLGFGPTILFVGLLFWRRLRRPTIVEGLAVLGLPALALMAFTLTQQPLGVRYLLPVIALGIIAGSPAARMAQDNVAGRFGLAIIVMIQFAFLWESVPTGFMPGRSKRRKWLSGKWDQPSPPLGTTTPFRLCSSSLLGRGF